MNVVAVSPRYTSIDLAAADLATKIDIFEDQMRGWLLNHAEAIASGANPGAQHAGFAVLTLVLVYIESIACFIKGATSDGRATEFFTFGMGQVFPGFDATTLKRFHDDFYRQVRCGQLHQGLVRGKVAITHDTSVAAIRASLDRAGVPTGIIIDPWQCLEATKTHLSSYVSMLRDARNVDARSRFETWFDGRAA